MNRQEFLTELWRRFLRPTFLIMVLVIAIRFLYRMLTNHGTERQLFYMFLGLTVVLVAFFILRLTLDFMGAWVKSGINALPEFLQQIIRATSKPLNYLGLIGLLVLTIFQFVNSNYFGMMLPGLYLLMHLKRLLTTEPELTEKNEI